MRDRVPYLEIGLTVPCLLPEGFGELRSLETLNLWNCKSLQSLPASEYHCFRYLYLRLCPCLHVSFGLTVALALSEGFGELASLQTLSLFRCEALESLPEGFGKLANLKDLDVWQKLKLLPDSFELKSLRV